jgi:hypothetical protein
MVLQPKSNIIQLIFDRFNKCFKILEKKKKILQGRTYLETTTCLVDIQKSR